MEFKPVIVCDPVMYVIDPDWNRVTNWEIPIKQR